MAPRGRGDSTLTEMALGQTTSDQLQVSNLSAAIEPVGRLALPLFISTMVTVLALPIAAWLSLPLLLLASPNLFGMIETSHDRVGFIRDVELLWLALGAGGVRFRTAHLFFLRGPAWGLAWAAKILLDPFHNVALYPATSLEQGLVWQTAFALALWVMVAVVMTGRAGRRCGPSVQRPLARDAFGGPP